MFVYEILPEVQEVLGTNDVPTCLLRLSRAVQALANEGQGIWDPMIGMIDICQNTDGCAITLPREVDTPLAVNVEGRPHFFRNKWFEFHLNGPGSKHMECHWAWDDRGDVFTIQDILEPSYLVAIADQKCDLTANVRFFAFDATGKWIRTQDNLGNWSDGFIKPLNLITDFPGGVPAASGIRLFVRNFAPSATTELIATGPHGLTTGAAVVLSLQGGSLPAPLINNATYYVGVIDPQTVVLYPTQSDAEVGVGAIVLTSYSPSSQILLDDQRAVATQTQFHSTNPHNIDTGAAVTFTATTLPVPIVSGTTYYAHVIDANDFTIHASAIDAQSGNNPIDVSTPGSNDLTAIASQPINPNTVINFNTNHNFVQGDLVFASNASGTLPSPLLPQTSYYVSVLSATQVQLYNTLADATAGTNPIVITTFGAGQTALFKTIPATMNVGNPATVTAPGHNLGVGDLISFSTTGTLPTCSPVLALGTNYQVTNPVTTNSFEFIQLGFTGMATYSRKRVSGIAEVNVPPAHGLTTGDYVNVTGFTLTDPSFDASNVSVTVNDSENFTYANAGPDVGSTLDATGIVTKAGTFNCQSSGTGQMFLVISRTISLGFTSQWQTDTSQITTGTAVKLSAVGALPSTSPVVNSSTIYYARILKTDSTTGELQLFETMAKAQTTAAIPTSTRQRATNVVTIVTSVNHGFSTGDYIDVTNLGDATYDTTHAQITVTNATTFTYPNTGTNGGPTSDTAGFVAFSPIQVFSLGSGALSLILSRAIATALRTNNLTVASSAFLANPATVQFQTTGTLPSPLAPLTNYLVSLNTDGTLSVSTTLGVLVTLTTIGSGTHTLNISAQFGVEIPVTFNVPSNEYNDGDAVVIQAQVGQAYVAPSPIVIGATYYVRRDSNDTIELYDTAAHAQAQGSPRPTTGQIQTTSAGSGSGQLAQTLPDFLVQRIADPGVMKDPTKGYLTVYAMDPGRSTGLGQIGYYYPDDVSPRYRRISVNQRCGWVRIRYRRRVVDFTSVNDWIPLSSFAAVTTALRALDLLRKDFDAYQDRMAEAVDFLNKEFMARQGPDAPGIQINAWVGTGVYGQWMT